MNVSKIFKNKREWGKWGECPEGSKKALRSSKEDCMVSDYMDLCLILRDVPDISHIFQKKLMNKDFEIDIMPTTNPEKNQEYVKKSNEKKK